MCTLKILNWVFSFCDIMYVDCVLIIGISGVDKFVNMMVNLMNFCILILYISSVPIQSDIVKRGIRQW